MVFTPDRSRSKYKKCKLFMTVGCEIIKFIADITMSDITKELFGLTEAGEPVYW